MKHIEELISKCEKIHSYIGWYCTSCDREVDATFNENCVTCGTPLDGSTITGNLVEAARNELQELKNKPQPEQERTMRITNAHREKIVNALTATQEKVKKDHVLELRQKAYDLARMALPAGILKAYENHHEFFHSTRRVQAVGLCQYVSFPEGKYLPNPARHPDVPAIAGDITLLQNDHRALRRKVKAALAPFTTFKKLQEGWPEAAAILPDHKKAVTALVDLEQVNKIRKLLNKG